MLSGFIGGLFVAWFLRLFDVDNILIGFSKDVFKRTITLNTYYVMFGVLGIVAGLFNRGLL